MIFTLYSACVIGIVFFFVIFRNILSKIQKGKKFPVMENLMEYSIEL